MPSVVHSFENPWKQLPRIAQHGTYTGVSGGIRMKRMPTVNSEFCMNGIDQAIDQAIDPVIDAVDRRCS